MGRRCKGPSPGRYGRPHVSETILAVLHRDLFGGRAVEGIEPIFGQENQVAANLLDRAVRDASDTSYNLPKIVLAQTKVIDPRIIGHPDRVILEDNPVLTEIREASNSRVVRF